MTLPRHRTRASKVFMRLAAFGMIPILSSAAAIRDSIAFLPSILKHSMPQPLRPGRHTGHRSLRLSRPGFMQPKKMSTRQAVTTATGGNYDFIEIQNKWQIFWDNNQTFRTPDLDEIDTTKPKFYVLDMFPYPSGAGLHVGHPEGYTATDIIARFKRMSGYNVMHPMGWDAFGLPAEQYAIQTGTHPRITTSENVDRFRAQLKSIGFSYDWQREVSTTDENYFRWTQWIFLKLYERGLAYQAEVPVNWCPALGTVLANEEVVDGLSERGQHPVYRKNLKQWMLKITAYADRLLMDLDELDWPESIKDMQRNWIGRSEGAQVDFPLVPSRTTPDVEHGKVFVGGIPFEVTSSDLKQNMARFGQVASCKIEKDPETCKSKGFGFVTFIEPADAAAAVGFIEMGGRDVEVRMASRAERYLDGAGASISVFTTRPETIFGATYVVLAPEHPLIDSVTAAEKHAAVDEYRRKASQKSDLERTELQREKSGVFTGGFAKNPLTDENIPIWIADYVLNSYGTGAVMAVPGHDVRDHDFATRFNLPIKEVVKGGENISVAAFIGDGTLVNSSNFKINLDGKHSSQAKQEMIEYLERSGMGCGKVTYKLRDWLFSRQRYWGEPFPISFLEDGTILPTPCEELPVLLPEVQSFQPSGTTEGPLSTVADWVHYQLPDGRNARRETNTMPQWAGSCWYYLRFLDPQNPGSPIDPEVEKYWMPVDLYVGGAEHAVLHLLYARFWHKVLHDVGVVSTKEPFKRLINQGLILGPVEHTLFLDESDMPVSAELATVEPQGAVMKSTNVPLKMEKVEDVDVIKQGSSFVLVSNPSIKVMSRAVKMSKSKGNVVNPDEVISSAGADALRMYLMFMGPLEQVKPWNTNGVEGVLRFLNRVWRLFTGNASIPFTEAPADKEQMRTLHATIQRVTTDTEKLSFNTAIAALMEFLNAAYKWDNLPREIAEPFIKLLNPYAPHLAEELWELMGHTASISDALWPKHDDSLLAIDSVTLAIQINGKLRASIAVDVGMDQDDVMEAAEENPVVQKWICGREIKKVIYVPGKILNLVVSK